MDKAKQTKRKDKGNMLTKTFSLFVERNKHARNKKTTGTSFLELFFDLGIVFVFALLAKNLPSYLGIFHMDSHMKGVAGDGYKSISLMFWIVNFIFLWISWRKYNKWFATNGGDNVVPHLLTLLLLMSMAMQAASLNIQSDFFIKYGLLISIVSSQGIFVLFYFIAGMLNKSLDDKDKNKDFMVSLITFVVTLLGSAVYVILGLIGELDPTLVSGTHPDYHNAHLSMIVLAAWIFFAEIVILSVKFKNNSYTNIHSHSKERHHLLMIITFGETVLFNLTSISGTASSYSELIPELVINLTIVMIMWYTYKTFIFKITYEKLKWNQIAYSLTHLLWIGTALFSYSMLSSYSNAIHSSAEIVANGKSIPDALNHAIEVTYPSLYLLGVVVFFITTMVFVMATHIKNNPYGKVIKGLKYHLLGLTIFVVACISIISGLLFGGIDIPMVWVLFTTMVSLIIYILIIGYLVSSKMIKNTDSIKSAVIEFEKLES